jgi:hypothetical protein
MIAEEEELARYRVALASYPAADGAGACPRPELVWEAVRGELRPRQVAELADHTLACADCTLAWQLAIELGRAAASARGHRPAVLPWRRQVWGGVLAAAAAVLLAVTIPWQDLGDRPASVVRGVPATGEIRSLLPPDEPLSRQDCVLRWESPWPDAIYSVRVLDEDFKPLAEASDLRDPEFPVPAGKLVDVAPGALLFWSVDAKSVDGAALDRATFQLVVE